MNLLSDAEKVDIRRFCGYPACGAAPAGMQSWRFFQSFGLLEFRINNLSDSEIAITRRYLGSLTSLEFAIPATSENLDTDQASMWTRNKDELRDRMRLFNDWRRRLCGFLGIAAGPDVAGGTTMLVV